METAGMAMNLAPIVAPPCTRTDPTHRRFAMLTGAAGYIMLAIVKLLAQISQPVQTVFTAPAAGGAMVNVCKEAATVLTMRKTAAVTMVGRGPIALLRLHNVQSSNLAAAALR
jgi:hypothetical protein